MHRNRKSLGNLGEDLAVQYLMKNNYKILQRNYRHLSGEIDIIASKDDLLIFVEVKTARSRSFGNPETWVNEHKQQQIGRVAEIYLQENEIYDVDCRFDVIAVTFVQNQPRIKHIKNAFWL